MNEKFLSRGKREDTGKWVEGYYVELPEDQRGEQLHIIIDLDGQYNRIVPETVGRCTGLTDKNGTLIFEGDIVRGDVPECLPDSNNRIGFVRYERSAFIIDFGHTREPWEIQKVGFCSFDNYEVIGNIHDNSKLIETN